MPSKGRTGENICGYYVKIPNIGIFCASIAAEGATSKYDCLRDRFIPYRSGKAEEFEHFCVPQGVGCGL